MKHYRIVNATRFRIFLITVALGLFLLGMILSLLFRTDVAYGEDNLPKHVEVTVESGDTVWTIATEHCGDRDVRDVVYEIAQENGLNQYRIYPGQILRVPRP